MTTKKQTKKAGAAEAEIVEAEKKAVAVIVERAAALDIKSEEQNQQVANMIVEGRERLKVIEDKIMAPARETKRQATANVANLEAIFVKPLEAALKAMRDASARFFAAEQARRDALQAKEDAKFEKAAEKAEATGKPLTVAPVIVQQVQTAGVSYRTVYFAEVTDLKALCRAVLENKVEASVLEPVMPLLNAKAKALKKPSAEICPGVFCREKKVVG